MTGHTAAPLDGLFAALSDPTRRRIVERLRHAPQRAGELAGTFGLSAPAMSTQLKILRKAGIVEPTGLEEDARVRVYRLRPEKFTELQTWLDEVRAYWDDQLASFKAHAEATRGKTKA